MNAGEGLYVEMSVCDSWLIISILFSLCLDLVYIS